LDRVAFSLLLFVVLGRCGCECVCGCLLVMVVDDHHPMVDHNDNKNHPPRTTSPPPPSTSSSLPLMQSTTSCPSMEEDHARAAAVAFSTTTTTTAMNSIVSSDASSCSNGHSQGQSMTTSQETLSLKDVEEKKTVHVSPPLTSLRSQEREVEDVKVEKMEEEEKEEKKDVETKGEEKGTTASMKIQSTFKQGKVDESSSMEENPAGLGNPSVIKTEEALPFEDVKQEEVDEKRSDPVASCDMPPAHCSSAAVPSPNAARTQDKMEVVQGDNPAPEVLNIMKQVVQRVVEESNAALHSKKRQREDHHDMGESSLTSPMQKSAKVEMKRNSQRFITGFIAGCVQCQSCVVRPDWAENSIDLLQRSKCPKCQGQCWMPDELFRLVNFYGHYIHERTAVVMILTAMAVPSPYMHFFSAAMGNLIADSLQTNAAYDVVIPRVSGTLGMQIFKRGEKVVVGGFTLVPPGVTGPAQLTQKITTGDTLIAINKESVRSLTFEQQVHLLGKAPSPIFLTFQRAHSIILQAP